MKFFFTHIFAPYAVSTSSLAGTERALVLESWQTAANLAAANGINVEFLACPLETDMKSVPSFANVSSPVTQYAIDPHNRKFPTIGGIFDKGVTEGMGDYLVYTNMDIGVHKDFYIHSYNLLINAEKSRKAKLVTDPHARWTALEYTRVQSIRLKPGVKAPTLTEVLEYPEVGRHPGHDCFILPRNMVPVNMRSGGLVVGMPPWGTMYHVGIQKDDKVDLLFLQGTSSQRYTFHTGVDGTVESWMDNQDFRLQQYSEAFRLFGAESIGRAWGAKGRNSPFYYMCNGTAMRFPLCSFCETFYPSTLYSEFSARSCKGMITDRTFFAHLPQPVPTPYSNLSCDGSQGLCSFGKNDGSVAATFSSGEGQLAKMLGRKPPCKVKCIQEKILCKKVSVRSWIPSGSRPPSPLGRSLPQQQHSSGGTSSLHASPPMLWCHSGCRSDWIRSMLENAFGYKTGSLIVNKNQASFQFKPQPEPVESEVSLSPTDKKKKKKPEIIDLELRHGCDMSMATIFSESIRAKVDINTLSSPKLSLSAQPALEFSPTCFAWPQFKHVVAVIRDPYDSIWQQYHSDWLLQKDPSFVASYHFSDSLSNKLALNFIGDGHNIDEFKTFAIKNANIWKGVHADLLRYKEKHSSSLFLLKFEDLDQNIEEAGNTALTQLSQFLGMNPPSANRLHCSYVSSKNALLKELNPLQKAASMDSLYEGLITCRMWTIFSDIAIKLGYTQPYNHMACFQIKEENDKLSSVITDRSVTMLNNVESAEESRRDIAVECGWFRWMLSEKDISLKEWLKGCESL